MTHTANPTTASCEHGISWQIEPPDEAGWMRESCGSCEQVLRYTLWPHHAQALAALSGRDGADFCADCGEEVAEADLVANEDTGETSHLQCLDPVEQVRHLQSQPGRWLKTANPSTACGGGGSAVDQDGRHVDACRICRGSGNA